MTSLEDYLPNTSVGGRCAVALFPPAIRAQFDKMINNPRLPGTHIIEAVKNHPDTAGLPVGKDTIRRHRTGTCSSCERAYSKKGQA